MIHRSRRSATFPARRGMRSRWLRCRVPDEAADATVGATGVVAADAPDPSAPDAGRPGPAEPPAGLAPVRPVHGHPTF